MTDTVVARRYASALFSLGRREGGDALGRHGACLAALGEMVAEEPKLGSVLKSPVIGVEEKKGVLGALLDKLGADKTMRNFCFLLADKERLGSLRQIADWYGILLDEANGVLRGKVITAVKLSKEKQAKLKAELAKKSGGDIELAFSVDPEILGGMVLAVGDKVLDSSLRAQLGILRETFKRGV
ncbi:MAG: F0F1 ATP synthase subunit delta [Desulfovibrio sp.]|nr:F0F1 ATP synthase subunit delta [Desulfovibrio sp.]MDE7371554.1 F0F1 ATP synthase subunit delta [Desulfovibrio sp.]